MKNKIIVAIASVALNLVLFAALMHVNNLNNVYHPTGPALFYIEHMPAAAVYPK